MKHSLLKTMVRILLLMLAVALVVNTLIQREVVHAKIHDSSEELFWQVDLLIQEDAETSEQIKNDFAEICIQRARTAARIIELQPEMEYDLAELRALADLVGVDEIHLFTTGGVIYSGTHPEYYNYSFASGEQMSFFAPMLADRSLALCQDITPNTAESKLMQYAAVWSEDGSRILQIGLEPARVQMATEQRTLNTIFAAMPTQDNTALYAIDRATRKITASTVEDRTGLSASACGFALGEPTEQIALSHAEIDGQRYCVNSRLSGDLILVRTYQSTQLFEELALSTLFLLVYFALIATGTIFMMLLYMDRKVVRELAGLNENLLKIQRGEKDWLQETGSVPEMQQLAGYINTMLKVVRDSSRKISAALERSKMPIGIYEYSTPNHRGFVTSRVRDILLLEEGECQPGQVAARIDWLKHHCKAIEPNTYLLRVGAQLRYIRLEEFDYEGNRLAILVDVTTGYKELERTRYRGDRDELTGLLNRRGFYDQLDELKARPGSMGLCAMVLLTIPALKELNDAHGHTLGDMYLREIARVLRSFPASHVVACRLNGDKFAVFFHGYEMNRDLENALRALESQNGLYSIQGPGGQKLPVEFATGCARMPEEAEDYHTLVLLANSRIAAPPKADG